MAQRSDGKDPVTGVDVLRNPLLNHGSGFTNEHRRALGLEGLLPAGVNGQSQQADRIYATLSSLTSNLACYRELSALQDRNEYLFYRVLMDHISEFMPIIYTPTVGEAAQRFSDTFQRGRGIWLTLDHAGRVEEILRRAVGDRDVQLLVVTDNESILGIGDQGVGGMTISIGKLALYTAAAGIAPECTLPISLDVGTDNETLLGNEHYLGMCHKRIRGADYDAFVEEFVVAVTNLFPHVLIQWEDFRKDNALRILDRYRDRALSFNDDIQGTGAVTLAGVFSALRMTGATIADQRMLVFGAGAAGLGIARQLKAALRMAGVAEADLQRHIGVLDSRGLLIDDVAVRDSYKAELQWNAAWATEVGVGEARDLAAVVSAFRPTVLIGSSGQAGTFTESMVRQIADVVERPVIMPLSNPTANAEATPLQLLNWTEGRALVATGSPFDDVVLNGRTHRVGQGNNVFIFPALGLAALLTRATQVTDNMITRTAQALAEQVRETELKSGLLYPGVERLREVTAAVAAATVEQAVEDGVAREQPEGEVLGWVQARMWTPDY